MTRASEKKLIDSAAHCFLLPKFDSFSTRLFWKKFVYHFALTDRNNFGMLRVVRNRAQNSLTNNISSTQFGLPYDSDASFVLENTTNNNDRNATNFFSFLRRIENTW